MHEEESAHRIGQTFAQGRAQGDRQATQAHSSRGELARAAARHVAARHGDIGLRVPRRCEELRHQSLVMLQVGVDHHNVRRGACQHALDARRSKPAPADAVEAAHTAVLLRAFADQHFAAVVGVIDHDNRLPVEPAERLLERLQQRRNVLALSKRRNHDRQLRHLPPWCRCPS